METRVAEPVDLPFSRLRRRRRYLLLRDREHFRAELRIQPGLPRGLELVTTSKELRLGEPVPFIDRDAMALHKPHRWWALVRRVEPRMEGQA